MPAYLAPGIYRRPVTADRSIGAVRTDIAGFVGFAERGPLGLGLPVGEREARDLVVRLDSWQAYQGVFGGFLRHGYLAYAVRAFFENGGRVCYVTRVAATRHVDPWQRPRAASYALPSSASAAVVAQLASAAEPGVSELELDTTVALDHGDLVTLNGAGLELHIMIEAVLDGTRLRLARPLRSALPAATTVQRYEPALRVHATSAGGWGNRLRLMVKPLEFGDAVGEFSLRVKLERGEDRSRPVEEEFYRRLSLDETSSYDAVETVQTLSSLIRLERVPGTLLRFVDGPLVSGSLALEGGRDGLSGVELEDFTGRSDDWAGLGLLATVDEVAILCAPDAVFAGPPPAVELPLPPRDPCAPPVTETAASLPGDDPTAMAPPPDPQRTARILQAMIGQCELLKDRVAIVDPPAELGPAEVVAFRGLFNSRFAALYYPWLAVPEPMAEPEERSRLVPPGGHVAGIYARLDNAVGVHQPPANAPLEFVTDLAADITHRQQEDLNPFGVNAIRAFPGRGIRVWGARSMAGKGDGDWRFIHVRRLMSMIEEAVEEATQWAVFENHDDALRRTLVHSLSVFLSGLWRRGGLKGARPDEAFFVKCDETNNPQDTIDAGQLICEVGVAVAAPMEFLVFELRRLADGAELVER